VGDDLVTAAGALPPLHGGWLRALTGLPDPPPEPAATCGDCVMCGGVERSGSRVTFSPDVKCCSYVPHLANFVAGRALAGPGRASVVDRIARRAGVTPLGLGLSRADLRRVVGVQAHFGQEARVRCPHFDERTQGCGIWESRNAVCSTWFCRHERGATGQGVWHAVRDLLIAAEEQVAHHCLGRAGLPDAQVAAVLDHRAALREAVRRANDGDVAGADGEDDASSAWYARMWGDWQGREEEWFAGCAEVAGALDAGQLAALLDDDGRGVEAVARRRALLAARTVPDRLVFAPGPASEATDDVLRLAGYSPFDLLVLPADLEPDLWLLDGRPRAEVPARLDDDVLGRLLDFGVAAVAEAAAAPEPANPEPANLDAAALDRGIDLDGVVAGALPPAAGRHLDLDDDELAVR